MRVKVPDYILKQFSQYGPLSPEEEFRQIVLGKAGDLEARNRVIMANCRFVVFYIKKHITLPPSMEIEDAINIGMEGLVKAFDSYDVDRKYKFITYAHWWIMKELYEAIYPGLSMISIPISRIKMVRDLEEMKICNENQGRPSGFLDVLEALFCEDLETAKKIGRSVAITMKAMNVFLDCEFPVSINSFDSMHESFVESLPAERYYEVDESHIGACIDAEKYLKSLDPRSKDIVCRHYGIGCQPQTYKEIGQSLALSGERTRQIVKKSIKIMKDREEVE